MAGADENESYTVKIIIDTDFQRNKITKKDKNDKTNSLKRALDAKCDKLSTNDYTIRYIPSK